MQRINIVCFVLVCFGLSLVRRGTTTLTTVRVLNAGRGGASQVAYSPPPHAARGRDTAQRKASKRMADTPPLPATPPGPADRTGDNNYSAIGYDIRQQLLFQPPSSRTKIKK